MKGSHLFWLSRSKGTTVDICIRDYNPPRCFQKKIPGRSKHNDEMGKVLHYFLGHPVNESLMPSIQEKCNYALKTCNLSRPLNYMIFGPICPN
jgi:hypothetical protein